MNMNWLEILDTIIYGVISIILMLLSIWIFDLIVPYDFNKELKENNTSAGYIIAGIYIAIAIIIRTVII